MTYPRIRRTLLCALASCSALTTPVLAQTTGQLPPPPVRTATDQNSVDVVSGKFIPPVQQYLSIGPENNKGLSLKRLGGVDGINSLLAAIEVVEGKTVVSIGISSDSFTQSGGAFVATEGNGATLTLSGGIYTYTSRDGTKATFTSNTGFTYGFYEGDIARLERITFPDGVTWTPTMRITQHCPGGYENKVCMSPKYYVSRIESLKSSTGYQLKPLYASNTNSPDDFTYQDWGKITDIIALNNVVEACDGPTCTLVNNWPRLSTATVPDLKIAVTYAGAKVQSATNHGVTYTYAYTDNGNERTTTVTDPQGGQKIYVGDIAANRVKSVRDELSRTTSYDYDSNGRVTQIVYPERKIAQYTYDARGNILSQTIKAKPGTGLADIVVTAGYDATCNNPKTCNQPNWTRDAKGNQTDYSYDPNHGGLLTITSPPDSNGVRPQKRYSYTLTDGMYFRTGESECRTNVSCTGTSDETKTTIQYGPAAQNYLPQLVSKGSGDGSLTATSSLTHNVLGQVTAIDGPLPGPSDTTSFRYNARRKIVGVVGPDPDGAGTRQPLAQRTTYDANDNITKAEIGTVTDASDTAWSAFASAQQVETTYDANSRPIRQELKAGGTTYSVTQNSYDTLGQPVCNAERMEPTQWAAQPDACLPQTGSANGPDRITKQVYDAVGQVTQMQTAVGTPEQSSEITVTYTPGGQVETLTDGENNKTSYEYDGHSRLVKTRYPVTAQGTNSSSTTDTETLTYDAASNVTQFKTRDDQLITYGHDNLNRVTSKTLPSGQLWNMTYGYDLQGRLKLATGNGAYSNSFTYDALGRMTVEGNYSGTTSHAYDIAGRQTRLTWNDGFFVDYDYDAVGNVVAIRENGAASGAGLLASYSYDNLGRRSSVNYGNGTSRGYSYDPASRLASLSVAMPAAPTSNLGQSFTYNPASQIASVTRSNDGYAWNGHANGETLSTINGLNQIVQQGSQSLSYDGRGNLISNGGASYSYNADNVLRTISKNGVTYELTPEFTGTRLLGLRNQATGQDMRFLWSGEQLIGELDGPGNPMARRYVPGPGVDEPIVWYEGAGATDRRFLHADERGSIVAVTNSSGGLLGINRYDEYGVPSATNMGRFGYTGQMWMPEVGLYNYKARFYDAKLGRFLQTDPIGYDDGMNMYNYVGNDPVNNNDPSGLSVHVNCGNWCIKHKDGLTIGEVPAIIVNGGCISLSCRSVISGSIQPGRGEYNTDLGSGLNGDIVVNGRWVKPKPKKKAPPPAAMPKISIERAPIDSTCIHNGKSGCIIRKKNGRTYYDEGYKRGMCQAHSESTRAAGEGSLLATFIGVFPGATVGAAIVGGILSTLSLTGAPPWCTTGVK